MIRLLILIFKYIILGPITLGIYLVKRLATPGLRTIALLYSFVMAAFLSIFFRSFHNDLNLNITSMSTGPIARKIVMISMAITILMYLVDKFQERKDSMHNEKRSQFALVSVITFFAVGIATSLVVRYTHTEDKYFTPYFYMMAVLTANMITGGLVPLILVAVVKALFLKKLIRNANSRQFKGHDGHPIYLTSDMDLNKMTAPTAFEYGVADLMKKTHGQAHTVEELKKMGKIKLAVGAVDQGADVIVEDKNGVRTVVQCKLYSKPVDNGAVQEVVAAKKMYNCTEAVIVTNHILTLPAMQLAQVNGVKVITGDQVRKISDELARQAS